MIPIITIDGPSSSGKGTIAQLLAKKLSWHFLDSGALYRSVALLVIKNNFFLNQHNQILDLANNLQVKFVINDHWQVLIDNQDVTKEIRSEQCGEVASQIAVIPEIRRVLLVTQRKFLQKPGLVTDGRDMGTIVFPEAKLKIYLTASVAERAKRRYKQLQENKINASLQDIYQDLIRRDERDSKRTISPLKQALDAEVVDSTNLTIREVVEKVFNLACDIYNLS